MFTIINIFPRWIIFLLDIICCIFSLCFAYFVRFNFDIDQINSIELSRNLLFFVTINSIVFFSIKTYAVIIRYTSAQDSFRILIAILLSNGIFLIINLIFISLNQNPIIPSVVLVVNLLTSFLILITYRVLVKSFFLYVKYL